MKSQLKDISKLYGKSDLRRNHSVVGSGFGKSKVRTVEEDTLPVGAVIELEEGEQLS